jgi:hypothetical protein
MITPFGLTDAPATFQRYINLSIREYTEFCTAYIDDILIYTDGTLEDYCKKVLQVIRKLCNAELQLDIDKSEFETTSIKYLSFIIEAGEGIKVDPEKVSAIKR